MAKAKSKSSKKISNQSLITAIALIVIGVLFCAFRSSLISVLMTVVGIVLIALGVYDIVKKRLWQGIIELVVGIVIIVCGWTIINLTLLILGLVFIAYGIYCLVNVMPSFKREKGFNKFLVIIKPLLLIIFGILLVVAKWAMGDIICIIIGVVAIVDGILMLIGK